jgi:TetR/AcrR family transcriptional regulator of autoinduction and epiphytic fitness
LNNAKGDFYMKQYKERDKSKKRAIIINGAEDIFLSMGYELASMDKIAAKAGVSKRTVYNHFNSKENLFEVIVDNLLAQRQNLKTIKYDREKTLEEQLLAFAESEIFLIDSPRRLELSRFLTITFLKDREYQRKTVAKYPSMYDMLIEWLKEAENDGKIKADDLFMSARIFYSLIIGAITWPVLFTDGINKEAVKPVLDEVIAVFLARYASKKPLH